MHPAAPPPLLQLLLLTLTFTSGATTDTFAVLLPAFFMGLLILGIDEVARWVALVVVTDGCGMQQIEGW